MVYVGSFPLRTSPKFLWFRDFCKYKRTRKSPHGGSFWCCSKEPLSDGAKTTSRRNSSSSRWNPTVLVRFAKKWLPSKEILGQWRDSEHVTPAAGRSSLLGNRRLAVLEYTQDILKPLQRLIAITKLMTKKKIERKDLASANSIFCMVGVNDNTVPIELHCVVENSKSASVSKRVTRDTIDTILLHGLLANTFAWRHIQKPLSEMTGGVSVAYDRPPFGLSSRPPGELWKDKEYNPYQLDYGVTLTKQVREYFQMDNIVLVGHSAGGTVALMSSLKEPQLTKGLVLIAPAVRISYSRTLSFQFLKRYYRSILRTPLLGRRIMRSRLQRYRTPKGIQELLQRNIHDSESLDANELIQGYIKPFLLPGWDQALVEMALSFEAFDLIPQLEGLKLPTLVCFFALCLDSWFIFILGNLRRTG
jgi:pimeloyl-ACP methyl ester carboxylesterase